MALERSIPTTLPMRNAEAPRLGLAQQVTDQLPVPFLEDVQRQQQAREEHGAKREQRQRFGHSLTLRVTNGISREDLAFVFVLNVDGGFFGARGAAVDPDVMRD